MHAVFRCDSTKQQGLGHVFRAVSVADAAIEAGHTVEFLARIESPVGRQLLADHSIPLTEPESTDPVAVAEWAAEVRADVVHVDTYEEQGSLRQELADRGIMLSNVEDGLWGRRSADVVIDSSPGSELKYRPSDGSFRLLRGVQAVSLRREIRADLGVSEERRASWNGAAEADVASREPLRALVVMGGTDARNMALEAAQLWRRAIEETGLETHVETTLVSPREDLDLPGMSVVKPGPGIARTFAHMDLIITGSGTTVWELAALGVPMALIQVVENQSDNYAFALNAGIAVGLGVIAPESSPETDQELLTFEQRTQAVSVLSQLLKSPAERAAMGERGAALVDGDGGARIIAAWEQSLASRAEDLSARPAEIDDASLLFDWRNDPEVRAVSREKGELDWGQHVQWLSGSLTRPDRHLLLIQRCGEPIATVRFDLMSAEEAGYELPRAVAHYEPEDSDNTVLESWEVSITLSAAARGKGLALPILREAEHFFSRLVQNSTGIELIAEMLESNPASYRLFEKAGYEGGLKDEGKNAASAHPDQGTQRWYRLRKSLEASRSV